MIAVFKYPIKCSIIKDQNLFSLIPKCRTENHEIMIEKLDVRKNVLTVRRV